MKYLILFLCLAAPIAHADTYGFLGFWHDPTQTQAIPHTKTTQENHHQNDAKTEIDAFCRQRDAHLLQGQTGCFALTPLHNTCAAAAWSRKRGLMRPDNVYIAVHRNFKQVVKLAQQACRSSNGWDAQCEVETAYCTDKQYYTQ